MAPDRGHSQTVRCRSPRSGAVASPLLAVLLLVDAVDAPLLLLALAGGSAVGAGLVVGEFAAQFLAAAVGGTFIGFVMGMAFGGVERVAELIYGPKEADE